tara:strand:+ start:1948 stop:4173 length:2226 start_codon:yes stop_codon:yes gene_type:complete
MAVKNKYVLEFQSKGVSKTKSEVDDLDKSQGTLLKNSTKLKAGIAVAGVAIAAMGKHALSTAAQFETLRTRLNSMYGSVTQGTKAFQAFQRVAASTPFAVKNVVEAGASLKAFGLDAEKNIKATADLAAFMGVDVVDAAQAMGRAFAGGAGAADVLRERGILQLIKDFKGIDDLTKLSLPEFRVALEETLIDPMAGVAGATTALSQTFEGSYSNMMDAVDRLSASVGDKLLPFAKQTVDAFTNMINAVIGVEDATTSQIISLQNETNAIRTQTRVIIDSNLTRQVRIQEIRKLQREYPDFLANIDAETVSNERLERALRDLNFSTKNKIDLLIQEQIFNDTIGEQQKLVAEVTRSYTNLSEQVIEFGQFSSEVDQKIKDGQGFERVIQLANDYGRFISQSNDAANANQTVTRKLFEEVATLFKEYDDGKLTLKDYTTQLDEVINREEFQVLNRTKGLNIAQKVNEEQENFKVANDNLNESLEKNAQLLSDINNEMQQIKNSEPLKEGDVIESETTNYGITNFLENIEKIPIVATRGTEKAMTAFEKFAGKFSQQIIKAETSMGELASIAFNMTGAIAMAGADSDKSQLKVQKAMVLASVAAGVMDAFRSAAGKGPVAYAKATMESATLVAQGMTQTKQIEKQMSAIDAAKAEIGGQTGASGSVQFRQYGMNEVVDGPTPIIAGEAGAELVQITPLDGPNADGPQGMGGSIIIQGNVLSRDFVRDELVDEIKEAIRQGYDFR